MEFQSIILNITYKGTLIALISGYILYRCNI